MGKILYCKNKPVYNITKNVILNKELTPNIIVNNPTLQSFTHWAQLRYSSGSNTFARMLKSLSFGQGHREKINECTYMLSFTDCYWMKDEKNPITFEEVSPYFTSFWTGSTEFKNMAIPTLYTPGFLNKEWRENRHLFKEGNNLSIELDCIALCEACDIPVEKGIKVDNGIELINFTNENVMLEHANASGYIDEENFTEEDILNIFGIRGLQMLVIDAIVGNGDRHAGNFGFLRDSNTGKYLGMAPLYDFDHALDDTSPAINKVFLQFFTIIQQHPYNKSYKQEIMRISESAKDFAKGTLNNDIFANRAEYLKNYTKEKLIDKEQKVASDSTFPLLDEIADLGNKSQDKNKKTASLSEYITCK